MGNLCRSKELEYTYVSSRNIKIPLTSSEKRVLDWENKLDL